MKFLPFSIHREQKVALLGKFFHSKIFIRFLLFAESPMTLYKFVDKDINIKVILKMISINHGFFSLA